MKILVTGGSGLPGSETARYYDTRGHEVVDADHLLRPAT